MNDLHTPPPAPQPKSKSKKVYRRKGFWIFVAGLVVVGAVANATAEDPGLDNEAAPQPTVTVTKTSPAAPAEEDAPARETTPEAAPTAEETSEEPASEPAVVPDVVGMNHRDAMGLLHERGFMVNEEDASPEGRMIILNSGWKVCRQDPAPGATDVLRVAIYSVKHDESC
ncbi:PASTA domain-containing protein [Streptomyces sp. TRM S81-3]|uniref:PASTA domain-containing protein n=1 Tax=Streptomyces griseicoloratus TaxID=2752516 RepID=A0A926L3D3_9ACTN|nr:PASTA domain-containing protein [Streptomyces griseicoloratus]MBD0420349.1 PASTA domain-containing protein [Streptomyces griseicoloratus]